jgi:hypothetical protein
VAEETGSKNKNEQRLSLTGGTICERDELTDKTKQVAVKSRENRCPCTESEREEKPDFHTEYENATETPVAGRIPERELSRGALYASGRERHRGPVLQRRQSDAGRARKSKRNRATRRGTFLDARTLNLHI